MDARAFLARAEDLFAAVPVRYLELQDVQNSLTKLAKSAYLSRLAGLKILASRLGNSLPKALANSSYLTNLPNL